MSLELLRENARKRMLEKADVCIQIMMGQQFRGAAVDGKGIVVPAQTMEEIAFKTVECNAMVRAYSEAVKIMDEEFKKIVDPRPAPEPAEDDAEPTY